MTIIAAGAIRPLAEPLLPGRHADAGGGGFTVATASTADTPAGRQEGASPARGAFPVAGAGALLALQEQVGQDGGYSTDVGDREARKHGRDILEALVALQKELLSGSTPAQGLPRLDALVQSMPTAHDPVLAGILNAIHLRAKLEILRMGSPAQVKRHLAIEPEEPASMTET